MTGQHVAVRVGGDTRDDPHEHVLARAVGDDRFQPVDVVGVVDDHQTDTVLHSKRDLLVGLGIAVQHDQSRIHSRLQRGQDLATPGHVEADALLDHHPLHGRARERLRREHHPRVRPARRQLVDVLARSRPERRLGDDEHRRTELVGQVVGAAAAHHQHAVVQGAARGEQRDQVAHSRPVHLIGRPVDVMHEFLASVVDGSRFSLWLPPRPGRPSLAPRGTGVNSQRCRSGGRRGYPQERPEDPATPDYLTEQLIGVVCYLKQQLITMKSTTIRSTP